MRNSPVRFQNGFGVGIKCQSNRATILSSQNLEMLLFNAGGMKNKYGGNKAAVFW